MSRLDPVIHPVKRLSAMAILANAQEAEFSYLRAKLDVSDSDLSKQMRALVDAGYVAVAKTGIGRGSTTIFSITHEGRTAYRAYVRELRAMLDAH